LFIAEVDDFHLDFAEVSEHLLNGDSLGLAPSRQPYQQACASPYPGWLFA
jgi:hypothetical protein